MKLLSTAIFAGMLAVSTAACSKEEVKPAPVQVAQAATPAAPAAAPKADAPKKDEPVYKTVCLDVQGKDGKPVLGKDGKPKQNCTKVRVREKFEGTKIEDAKKQ